MAYSLNEKKSKSKNSLMPNEKDRTQWVRLFCCDAALGDTHIEARKSFFLGALPASMPKVAKSYRGRSKENDGAFNLDCRVVPMPACALLCGEAGTAARFTGNGLQDCLSAIAMSSHVSAVVRD